MRICAPQENNYRLWVDAFFALGVFSVTSFHTRTSLVRGASGSSLPFPRSRWASTGASRSSMRNMQNCLQVEQSFSASHSSCQTCILTLSHTCTHSHTHAHTYTQILWLLHFPKLPKLAKASCLGGTMAGVMECVRPIPTPGTPMPAMPPIITGVVMPIFMLMFIPIMPWFTGIPMVPVVIEGGILAAIEGGMPIVMALPGIMGLAGGLMGVTWGGELRFSPPKFWASRLMGGTPAQRHKSREGFFVALFKRDSSNRL